MINMGSFLGEYLEKQNMYVHDYIHVYTMFSYNFMIVFCMCMNNITCTCKLYRCIFYMLFEFG